MGSRLRQLFGLTAALAASLTATADGTPSYTLGIPGAKKLFVPMKEAVSGDNLAWAQTNAAFVAFAGVSGSEMIYKGGAPSYERDLAGRVVRSRNVAFGFPAERAKPMYYLGDTLIPPDGVSWDETYKAFSANEEIQDDFLFDTLGCKVYVTLGETVKFPWVLKDENTGELVTNECIIISSPMASGRPKNIFWTDAAYGGRSVDVSGKFVKLFGPKDLLTKETRQVPTGTIINGEMSMREEVSSGVYIDETGGKKTLYAAGELTGQFVLAYYDSANYERIVDVQAVQVSRPQTIVHHGSVGAELKPTGRGYGTDFLDPYPTTLDAFDDKGAFLYQHTGEYPYSPKNGSVFALRPSDDKTRNQTQIYWMETDRQGVKWPFEVDEYLVDWPKFAAKFVRSGDRDQPGRGIRIPSPYTATLMKWQEDTGDVENHARAVADDEFVTMGPGRSLLKLTGDDDIWFMPVESILRTDTTWFDLSSRTDVAVGQKVEIRVDTDTGLVPDRVLQLNGSAPGYIYEPESDPVWNAAIYDPYGVASDGLKSVIYPVTAAIGAGAKKGLEVWWFSTFKLSDMPVEIDVPSLPQKYTVSWPGPDAAPQIVLASQLGSKGESTFRDGAALTFESEKAHVELPSRRYFSAAGGTLAFWTQPLKRTEGDFNRNILTFNGTNGNPIVSLVTESGPTGTLAEVQFGVTFGNQALGEVKASIAGAGTADWRYVAVTWTNATATVSVGDGKTLASVDCALTPEIQAVLGDLLGKSYLGVRPGTNDCAEAGAVFDEFRTWNKCLSAEEVRDAATRWSTALEPGLTFFLPIMDDSKDLPIDKTYGSRYVTDLVHGTQHRAFDCQKQFPGAIHTAALTFPLESSTRIYRQADPNQVGCNPNEEHAFVEAGGDGMVAWALRCDLNKAGRAPVSEPGVLVEYVKDGERRMRYFHVLPTNETYSVLGDVCEVGRQLPGPKPLLLFDDPWLKETYWDKNETEAFRDRKGQVWARCAGGFDIFMYYAQQATFDWPSDLPTATPEVGEAVPWLAYLTNKGTKPEPWHWSVVWPENVPELKIAQTLATAENGLPEMWNAQSMAVLYPIDRAGDVVKLTDPTVARGVDLDCKVADLAEIGLKTGPGQKLLEKKGMYYFQGVSPSLSQRLYLDPTANRLVLQGVKESNPGGVELLHVNVLSSEDYDSVLKLVEDSRGSEVYNSFKSALDKVKAFKPVEPTTVEIADRDGIQQPVATYEAPDHYALVTMGMTNWVVVIENDATNSFCDAGNPINMHVMKVVPEYYTGRIVTREDPNNLLSQVLGVHYSEALSGRAENFVFDWRKADPNPDGTIPTDYDNDQVYKPKFSEKDGIGRTSFSIGGQGDTLADMVNSYYVCRYRATDTNSPAWQVMGDAWSGWVAPPALAEGWVQRVMNNVTPFTQRMTDLYNNEAETAVSWMQQAGKPYTGDVALNQENLTSVGLIELYRTILNKAESMSLLQGINDAGANKQLLLAVERLADLYTVLGDEAYSDAANPTIGFGSNFGDVETGLQIDYGAASSSLFAFDNQVPTLLDEELALLRGRSCVNAPGNTVGPYYNRLVWNFTKGITAGEVAYAVNYNISGRQTSTLTASTAAELYPQGHGDAYGHYLSALQGWYRLLRNPYFSWGVPAMGEMNVADNVVNVDYYDEAKFAEAAASVARTAERVVELTAIKHYRDNAADSAGGGYLDSDEENAFGVGEWASRGTFGALCNWAVANSLLPEEAKTNDVGAAYADKGLLHIDRGTVAGLGEMVSAVESIQRTIDRLDAGLNPLGLDENAIPFDLTPLGSAKDATHFEQIRERAAGAFDNAKKILDRAQEYSNRLRILDESRAGMVDSLDDMESDLTAQLIAIYGRPYSDDIGPGKTYQQGYTGPDLYHYMWMDVGAYGFSDVDDTIVRDKWQAAITAYKDGSGEIAAVADSAMTTNSAGTLEYHLSASGLVLKPENVKGERPAVGELQLAYADFLRSYGDLKGAIADYDRKKEKYGLERDLALAQTASASVLKTKVDKVYGDGAEGLAEVTKNLCHERNAISGLKISAEVAGLVVDGFRAHVGVVGLSNSMLRDTESYLQWAAFAAVVQALLDGAIAGLEIDINNTECDVALLQQEMEKADHDKSDVEDRISNWERLLPAVQDVSAAIGQMEGALAAVQSKQDAVLALLEKGRQLQETRELQRQQAVNNIAKMRYNDMFFRKLRNETLSKYDVAFRQAQTYAFLAAKAYCYETGSLMADGTVGGELIRQILGARALGETDANGKPIVSANGDAGLAGALAKMDANWAVAKTQLGLNNPQPYATWFSLRHGLFRILGDETGDDAWKTELSKYWVDDIRTQGDFVRHCQPFASQFGLADQEPGLIIPFETTVDFAKNLFGNDLAFDDAQFDSSWFATKIAAAGVWFEGYNEKREGYKGQSAFATTPNVYLVPVGTDVMRSPGSDGEEVVSFDVVDQTIPVPHPLTAAEIAEANRLPLYTDGTFGGVDAVTRIRRHPSFRAYYGKSGESPNDSQLDATRLVGRSVWNTRWLLVIPAGTLNANRTEALKTFIEGLDIDRDGVVDVKGVRDIKIGFKTYSHSGK